MKENYEAYFRLSQKEIEIAGPVEFVKEQISANSSAVDLFVDMMKTQFHVKQLPDTKENLNALSRPEEPINDKYTDFEEVTQSDDVFKKYENIIAKNGEKLQILVAIPGDSLTQRMVTVVLLYLYLKLKSNIESVSFDELRETCERHGELDKGHFSAYMKSNKKIFIIEGSGKSASAKLTIPGIRDAEKILNSLNNQNSN
jgi:hypothetical protein